MFCRKRKWIAIAGVFPYESQFKHFPNAEGLLSHHRLLGMNCFSWHIIANVNIPNHMLGTIIAR